MRPRVHGGGGWGRAARRSLAIPRWSCAARLALAAGLWSCAAPASSPDAAAPDARQEPQPCAELPTTGLLAVFRWPSQPARHFRVLMTRPEAMTAALGLWHQGGAPAIPMGQLRCRAPVGWNCGWLWHLDPASVELSEMAIELCDAAPPVTDAGCDHLVTMTEGLWCPWIAQLVELRDCRDEAACQLLPR